MNSTQLTEQVLDQLTKHQPHPISASFIAAYSERTIDEVKATLIDLVNQRVVQVTLEEPYHYRLMPLSATERTPVALTKAQYEDACKKANGLSADRDIVSVVVLPETVRVNMDATALPPKRSRLIRLDFQLVAPMMNQRRCITPFVII
ncbi:hypothetical protein [Fibrella forsythiae]|uniref:Uncharacterized protein n=1 Tax=Fibrella forsythiae TaxID=2817061 RepID=A0ABS3JDG4_9BACT|nr:hypothetical protein [Fibrella forsythiae]MBO0947309.1 hypothetical protein [Fibrella forsythiae]